MFEYASNKLEIKVGEFNDCRTVEPDQNGYYLVFSDYCYSSIPLKKRLNPYVWSFVVGHGWNCHVRDDGTVSDEHRIEIDHPAYWAPLTVIEKKEKKPCPCETCQTAIDRCGCQMHLCSDYQKWKEGDSGVDIPAEEKRS